MLKNKKAPINVEAYARRGAVFQAIKKTPNELSTHLRDVAEL